MQTDKSIDFYEFLGLNKNNVPFPNSKQNRTALNAMLESKFKELAPKFHPDRGGNSEDFKLLIRAITVLGNEQLRSDYDGIDSPTWSDSAFNIDWDKYFTFEEHSAAASLGRELSQLISNTLHSESIFSPTQKDHGYNWIFNHQYNNENLTLSMVYTEDSALFLTDGSSSSKALPFKIYLYIPSSALKVELDNCSAIKVPGESRYLVTPKTLSAEYNDIILISTTDEQRAKDYIIRQLSSDLNMIKNGDMVGLSDKGDIKSVIPQKTLRQHDMEILKQIFDIKTPKHQYVPDADKFLDKIKSKPIKRITEATVKITK